MIWTILYIDDGKGLTVQNLVSQLFHQDELVQLFEMIFWKLSQKQ